MKKPFFNKHTSRRKDAPPSSISAATYASLPPDLKAVYRPVDPRYERLPIPCIILYAIAAACLVLYAAMGGSVVFADWFNTNISSPLRALFALLTAWIPFSVGESLIWLSPVILFLVLRHAIRHRCDTWRTALVYIGILGSVVVTLFSLFVLNFAAGYRGRPLEDKLELDRTRVSAQELYDTAVLVRDEMDRVAAEISFGGDGFSVMPYTLAEMNGHLSDAYATVADTYDFIPHFSSRVKPVLASEVMSHMHITGVYTFFTGEANINVGFPDYTIPYTAAHELAHQRGIAREDEANFVAFLVCDASEDPYIRYSGYLNLYEFLANALYGADRDLYYKLTAEMREEVRGELRAYSAFYDKYRDSVVSNVSSTINNSYLQSQGTPGTKSYGMVVDLAVAYFRPAAE